MLKSAELRAAMVGRLRADGRLAAGFRALIADEYKIWAPIVKATGFKLE